MSLSRAYFSRANRRGLLRKGAALSAVAAVSAGLMTPARAQSDGSSLLNRVLDRGTLLVHRGVPDAVVSQFDSNANTILAIDSGRADASLADYSTGRWYAAQFPDKYKFAPDPWGTHSYVAAVKQGDPTWLGFVNSVFHAAMTGLDFEAYREPFERYFGDSLVLPPAGFPTELS